VRTFSWSTCCALTSIALFSFACDIQLREATDPSAAGVEAVTARVLGQSYFGLTDEEIVRFDAGRHEFEEIETIEEGLGPVFNEASCATCHNNPVGSTNARAETRFGSGGEGVRG
jgi:hypothetical protein